MIITIDNVLKRQGKTRYWLSQQIGITYPNMKRLCDNQTSSIRFSLIESICIALECKPNDIFEIGG
jgi:putative transcriptional regulator